MKTIDEINKQLLALNGVMCNVNEMLEDLKKEIKELKKNNQEPESWDVNTPVDWGGNILFNNNEQLLRVNHGLYAVYNNMGQEFSDCRFNFKWVATTRAELKPGDTAYRANNQGKECHFDSANLVCKVLDDKFVVYVNHNCETKKCSDKSPYWFKLVRR